MRRFNTSGPNIPSRHYTLMREKLVEKGLEMVHQERYFTIWAPRQTGKTTYFRLLSERLYEQGYKTCQVNLENYINTSEAEMLTSVNYHLSIALGKEVVANTFVELQDFIFKINSFKFIWIIDEIEGLNPAILGLFLHTIRNLYHSRESHCLKSVILVGVSNIVGVIQDNASPFNITDNLSIPYFSTEETYALLGQHEQESGQLFEEKVKAKIADITANQPGLVNGFAQKLVEDHPDQKQIVYSDYLGVENWYLNEAIDKNASNIVNKAKKFRAFVETLLFTEVKIPFQIEREEIKVLHANGLIKKDEDGYVTFWVPFYKKKLYQAFYPYTNGEGVNIGRNIFPEEFMDEKNQIDFTKIIQNYREYVLRRGFNRFREKDAEGKYQSVKEAALVYSFETYIQAFLQVAEGKSYLEAHTGLGRTDMIIYLKNREYVVEMKIFYDITQFKKGKKQLAYYCKSLGLTEGIYLVFSPNHIKFTEFSSDSIEEIEGVEIFTYIVPYDEEKDF
ncbi:MAG: AAA-like domain-containing protein [Microscillaceae bacterium]|nr:AAA-like domain-containing protein [Microscillaceae bacterium]